MTTFFHSRKGRLTAVALLIVLAAGIGIVGLRLVSTRPEAVQAYVPTASEQPMFTHLRPATAVETDQADAALYDMRYDWKISGNYDTYVARSDFRTVYTTHPMVIMMRPGVTWLGGPLGQIWLVMQYLSYTNSPAVEFQNFRMAHVVYDPFCRAYSLGFATRQSCEATPEERRALTGDQRLQELTPRPSPFNFDVPRGRGLQYAWTTPVGTSTHLVEPPTNRQLNITVFETGQMITGGEFGRRYVFAPAYRKVYFSPNRFELQRVLVVDRIAKWCTDGIKPYLGEDVLAQYAGYCR